MNAIDTTKIELGSEARGGADWKFALLGGLSGPTARRIFTAAEFHNFVRRYRSGASSSTARIVADMLVNAGALRRVSSGVFLNRRSMPPAELTEVAGHIRRGAIISLHSVLGEIGFLNNPSALVVAVLPTSSTKRPKLGEVKTSAGDTFRFYGLAERFFPQTDQERFEMLQPGRPCDMFRPEAAVLHWLHLASMQRSTLTAPPIDVDMETLDVELLGKLANRWGVDEQLTEWMQRAEALNFGEEPDPTEVHQQSPTALQLEASAAARARLMGRRGGS